MATNWYTNYPRNQGPQRRINDRETNGTTFSLRARLTGAAQNNSVDNTVIALAQIDNNTGGWVVGGGSTTFTCQQAGEYRLTGSVTTNPDGVTVAWGNIVGLDIDINAVAAVVDWHTSLSTSNFAHASGIQTLAVGDVVTMSCKNTSGANSGVTAAELHIELISE
jgi:hypothetical protein